MKAKGILFSGSEENVELAKNHIKKHGIVYWSLRGPMRYEEHPLPITALLHITKKDKHVHYKCTISNVMRFCLCHFEDLNKKPAAWIEEQKIKKERYEVTFVLSKMVHFHYEILKLKNWEGRLIRGVPQGGYFKVSIPD